MTTVEHTCPPGTLFAAALRGHAIELLDDAARTRPLAVLRWSQTTESDRFVLSACEGATLDVGCGPGRMTSELTAAGETALGIDVVPEAVAQTRARGARAMVGDVFDDLPGHGTWQTVLLADGNIGIGGDPVKLLSRVAELLAPGGKVVVDLAGPGFAGSVRTHRLAGAGMVSDPFPWAVVGIDEIALIAHRAGLSMQRTDACELEDGRGRWFAVLGKPRTQ